MNRIHPSEITPEDNYLSRRQFLSIGGAAIGALALSACMSDSDDEKPEIVPSDKVSASISPEPNRSKDEYGNPLNTFEDITSYNNFYEFSTDKEEVSRVAKDFRTHPWTVEVNGLVNKPNTYAIEDILAKYPVEERIYRLRCVEGWSMVIPWLGFELNKLLKEAEPTSSAKFVRFVTLYDPDQMRGQKNNWFDWPYVEGLRLDEALHELTILSPGLYGKELLPQNGAPLRLVVPWKYGFKSIKSIVKIELVADMPTSLWMAASPNEYGFYANVNPEVDHPRWSQANERRIGEIGRRKTLKFNGYEEEVSHLYSGMDLSVNY